MPLLGILILLAGCWLVGGCSAVGSYQSKQAFEQSLYSAQALAAFDYEGPRRNPVIVIHGFLGSRLRDDSTGKEIWGTFSAAPPSSDELIRIAHPMAIGKSLHELTNGTSAFSMLDHVNIRLMGLSFSATGYADLLDILQKGGYYREGVPLPPGKNFYSQFVFYYDWRRDLPENAARLHQFIMQKRVYLREVYRKLYQLSDYDVQFDVVAHSMGGLLTRYYLRYGNRDLPEDGSLPKLTWAGARYIDRLIIVGTPNAGYLDTFIELVNGLQLAPGAPVYPQALLGTFPTYYQMLPSMVSGGQARWKNEPNSAPLDLFSPGLWVDMKWGLADPRQDAVLKILLPNVHSAEERRRIALDHQAKCLKRARQFTAAMAVKARVPENVVMNVFVGDAVPTACEVLVDRPSGKITVSRYDAGDGKILASSVRFDRPGDPPLIDSPIDWRSITHVKAAHMGITSCSEFAHNFRFYLLMMPTPEQWNQEPAK